MFACFIYLVKLLAAYFLYLITGFQIVWWVLKTDQLETTNDDDTVIHFYTHYSTEEKKVAQLWQKDCATSRRF